MLKLEYYRLYGYFKASRIKEDLDFKSKKAHQRLMIFTECNRKRRIMLLLELLMFQEYICYLEQEATFPPFSLLHDREVVDYVQWCLHDHYHEDWHQDDTNDALVDAFIFLSNVRKKEKKKGHIQVAFSFLDRHFSACLRWCIWNLQPEKKNGASQKAPRAFE
ncbi:hypothetical protein POUND7_020174 [Theobroma cacao]